MKAAAFDYVRPSSVTDAVALVGGSGSDKTECQFIAGGQSLLATMNLRVSSPGMLIDVSRLPELNATIEEQDAVRFGACVTHSTIEDGLVPDPSRGMMPLVASKIAYRAVRNRGTLGGSLALADPSADWVTVLPALGAKVVLASSRGRRAVEAAEFTTGIYETERAADEMILEISVPKLSSSARWGFAKFCRKSGEFASSIAAIVIDPARNYSRLVLGGVAGAPVVLRGASQAMMDAASPESIIAASEGDLNDRAELFDAYQRRLHSVMISRAIAQVFS